MTCMPVFMDATVSLSRYLFLNKVPRLHKCRNLSLQMDCSQGHLVSHGPVPLHSSCSLYTVLLVLSCFAAWDYYVSQDKVL
jgi:hypothetical protein